MTIDMNRQSRMQIKMGRSLAKNEAEAVAELREMILQPNQNAIFFFCSSRYDLNVLGKELEQKFACPLIGCTTAGEISTFGYQEGGIVGASIASEELHLHNIVISPLSSFSLSKAEKAAATIRAELSLSTDFNKKCMFGFMLIDGLSLREEVTLASLYNCFEGIPIIGGSSGDDLAFRKTAVYAHGRFISDAAVFSLFETSLPFMTFKTQHFQPTENKIVITGANPAQRIITEINGEPASQEYARVIGLDEGQLTATVFSQNPLLIKIGGDWHVRAIYKMNEDHSLSIFSAIEEGLVMTIGKGVNILRNFEAQITALENRIPRERLFLLCDCILRKLELNSCGELDEMNRLLSCRNNIGFSTYGEQFNSIHVNQTLTGVVIGG